jgi:hypothetical protein
MTTSRSTKKEYTPAKSNVQVTPEEGRIEPVLEENKVKPASLEVATPTVEPEAAAPAVEKEQIETDIRTKLNKRSDGEDIFVPSNPVALENAAASVAETEGFELNRGTSIGARLMAKARKLA